MGPVGTGVASPPPGQNEVRIDVVPILLVSGIRLFENLRNAPIGLEQMKVTPSKDVIPPPVQSFAVKRSVEPPDDARAMRWGECSPGSAVTRRAGTLSHGPLGTRWIGTRHCRGHAHG